MVSPESSRLGGVSPHEGILNCLTVSLEALVAGSDHSPPLTIVSLNRVLALLNSITRDGSVSRKVYFLD